MDGIVLIEPWTAPPRGTVYHIDEFIHQLIMKQKDPSMGVILKTQINGYLSNVIPHFWAWEQMKVISDSKFRSHPAIRRTLWQLRKMRAEVKLLWIPLEYQSQPTPWLTA